MKHPSEYTTVPLGAFHVMVVDAGTVIRDDATGREETVDEVSIVCKSTVIYCTDLLFSRLKRAIEIIKDEER